MGENCQLCQYRGDFEFSKIGVPENYWPLSPFLLNSHIETTDAWIDTG